MKREKHQEETSALGGAGLHPHGTADQGHHEELDQDQVHNQGQIRVGAASPPAFLLPL